MNENSLTRQNNPTTWIKNKAFTTLDMEEAVRLLNDEFPVRRIDEELSKIIKIKAEKTGKTSDEIKQQLLNNLCPKSQFINKEDYDKEMNKTRINLKNWLTKPESGKKKSINRESVIKIAFALQMTYKETEEFLKKCWLDGFYMRDVNDVIYRHGLENGWSYDSTVKMAESFSYLDLENPDPEIKNNLQEKLDAAEIRLTEYLSAESSSAQTKEELADIIHQNEQYFGSFRRKAYERFKELYEKLKNELKDNFIVDYVFDSLESSNSENLSIKIAAAIEPSKGLIEASSQYSMFDKNNPLVEIAKKVTTEEICDAIVKGIPEMRERNPNDMIRKIISENIPCRQDMSSILHKHKLVDRKLLMMTWLSCEDGFIDNFQTGKAEDDFMEHMLTLNDLLKAHGMAELDARHPFDWLIMNSLRCGYILDKEKKNKWIDDIEYRLQAVIEKM